MLLGKTTACSYCLLPVLTFESCFQKSCGKTSRKFLRSVMISLVHMIMSESNKENKAGDRAGDGAGDGLVFSKVDKVRKPRTQDCNADDFRSTMSDITVVCQAKA